MALGRVPHPDLPMVPLLMNPGQLNMELGEEMLGMELPLVARILMKLPPLMPSLSPPMGISI